MKHALHNTAFTLAITLTTAFLLPRAQAATVTWNTTDETWDTTSNNWTGGSPDANKYVEGDEARFTGSGTFNVAIQAGGVAPSKLYGRHYQCDAYFSGGDLGGAASVEMFWGTDFWFDFGHSLTFSGGMTIAGGSRVYWRPTVGGELQCGTGTINLRPGPTANGGEFYLQPGVAGALLDNTISIVNDGTDNQASLLGGNGNADWASTPVTLAGKLTVPAYMVEQQDNMAITLTGNSILKITHAWNDTVSGAFNGAVGGNYTLTVDAGTYGPHYSRITGPGNWSMAEFVKTGVSLLKVEAPEVFGSILKISSGKIELSNASHSQTVYELWLGGVQKTAYGTYGSSTSGADYQDDTYFQGPGKVALVPPPGTVLIIE